MFNIVFFGILPIKGRVAQLVEHYPYTIGVSGSIPDAPISGISSHTVRYIFGVIFIVLGAAMVIWTEKLFGWVGQIQWAETHIGPGGTRTFIKLLGLAVIFIALLLMTGTVEDILTAIFVPKGI